MATPLNAVRLLMAVSFLFAVHSSPTPADIPRNHLRLRDNAIGPEPASTSIPIASHTPSPLPATSSEPTTQGLKSLGSILKKGYVAFGDSYAAGMGAGATAPDSCRRGSTSYPEQISLHRPSGAQNFDFQNLPCSGAKVISVLQKGPNSQIDKWQNPGNADIATISIGGSDVGLSTILDVCVLGLRTTSATTCDEAVANAYSIMAGKNLRNDTSTALHQIIDKSGRSDFRVFMTGYPAFFNADTNWCDDVTFSWWNPHHRTTSDDAIVALTKALRLKLNQLVFDLNTLLQQISTEVNNSYKGAKRVTFVDPSPYFGTHRLCDVESNGQEVKEPNAARADTYFFLSAWADNELPNVGPIGPAPPLLNADGLPGTATLPDPNTCDATGSKDTDPNNIFLCDIAQTISVPGSQEAKNFPKTGGTLAKNEISGWVPTRQIKTFHPKTLGHLEYVIAINNAI